MDLLFIEMLPVPATRFRPISVMGEQKYENSMTVMLKRVLEAGEALRGVQQCMVAEQTGAIPTVNTSCYFMFESIATMENRL